MDKILITGSSGLIGAQAVRHFATQGYQILGCDNDMRAYFFGPEASTFWQQETLQQDIPNFSALDCDIRDLNELEKLFQEHGSHLKAVIHTAAQPSHDWAAKEPFTDFSINANGTLNLLEMCRKYAPQVSFIFTSTNKVYGDLPNALPLKEMETRWELSEDHAFYQGINETMSIDQSKHSLFGASKVAADILVQEYGRYFGMNTVCFRGGCLTGPGHSGAQLHGFLSYLMKCCVTETPYTIFGYKGKQVRDNIHASDLVLAFESFFNDPKPAAVYNMGGGRENSCSILEAIQICEEVSGKKLNYSIEDQPRAGDHQWYVSDLSRFQSDYPQWQQQYSLKQTLEEIYHALKDRKSENES